MAGSNAYKNSFRMGLPKPNRFQPSAGFRKTSSLNGRSWMNSPKSAAKVSAKNNSNYAVKPRVSEMKKQDALYRQRAFMLRMSGAKSAKVVAGALMNASVNKLQQLENSTKGFLSFSPWDSRFPNKYFDSFSPFDVRFNQFAEEKIYRSFSPFDSRFPNYPYQRKSTNFRRGYQSFSPFDSRFPTHCESYSPFDAHFPTGGTAKPYPTYSPFDERFPRYIYTKRHLMKSMTKRSAAPSQATFSLNKNLANKKVQPIAAPVVQPTSAKKPVTPVQIKKESSSSVRTRKAINNTLAKPTPLISALQKPSYLTVASGLTPKASLTNQSSGKNFGFRATSTQTVKKSVKAVSTGTSVTTEATAAQTTSMPSSVTSVVMTQQRPRQQLSPTMSFIASAPQMAPVLQKTSVRVTPVTRGAPIFLPSTTAAPLADAFPRFTPTARTTQMPITSHYRPPHMSMGRGNAPSPLSSVLNNGGGYYANMRFGPMM